MKSRRFVKSLAKLALVCAVAAVVVWLLHPHVLTATGAWLNVGERLQTPVDAIMVLGGDAKTRSFTAAAVYRAGYARTVLVPETELSPPALDGSYPSEAELIRRVLLARGVPPGGIVALPGAACSTADEARQLAAYLADNPAIRVAVVTNDYHTRRARYTFRRILGKNAQAIHVLAAPADGMSASNWWKHPHGTLTYVSEYAKLVRSLFVGTGSCPAAIAAEPA